MDWFDKIMISLILFFVAAGLISAILSKVLVN
jgi:hypothetical protein